MSGNKLKVERQKMKVKQSKTEKDKMNKKNISEGERLRNRSSHSDDNSIHLSSVNFQLSDFLPTTRKEMELRGWDEVDVVLFSGDAYVDHPSFGAAVIGRILEAEGLRVAIVPQPNWRDDLRDFRKMGRPRLFFGVTAGCMDSIVNKYTANKRLRS